MQEYNDILLEAVRRAGDIMKNSLGQEYTIGYKECLGQKSIVTSVDKACEASIISLIHLHYPEHSIYSEESGKITRNADYQWIIDPIDGTLNFVRNIPLCACSIALKIRGQIVLGAVYNPFSEELFSAGLGQGARLNNQSIQVSPKTVFKDACLILGLRHNPPHSSNHSLTLLSNCINQHIPVRQLGAAALNMAWVAAGRADAYYQGSQLELWDIAAAQLILSEAGGIINNFEESSNNLLNAAKIPGFLASNGYIFPEFIKLLNKN